jgi:hypothetical protein
MKLKRLFAVEIASAVVVIAVIMALVEFLPYLTSASQNNQIGTYNQRQYTQKTVTLQGSERATYQFNYTTYDPAILVVDLHFQNWQTPGYLSLYCNGILIVTVDANPSKPDVQLTSITVSGFDLVKPPPPKSVISFLFSYGNEISLVSAPVNGYAGTFTYTVSIRGSR